MKLDIAAVAFAPQPLPVIPQASSTPVGPVTPTAHLARMLPGFEPETAINAQDVALAECLNRPVHDILARLGGPLLPDVAPPAGRPPNSGARGGAGTSFDPSQLIRGFIQPATDAFGRLGSWQCGNVDPTQMFQAISQALGSGVNQCARCSQPWTVFGGAQPGRRAQRASSHHRRTSPRAGGHDPPSLSLGEVSPVVIGEMDIYNSPGIDLRI